jgi:hypothetical protein
MDGGRRGRHLERTEADVLPPASDKTEDRLSEILPRDASPIEWVGRLADKSIRG